MYYYNIISNMAKKARLDDEVRIRIMLALLQEGALVPNLERIKQLTGYHKNTIQKSLKFLKEQAALTGYAPLIDPKAFGFKLQPISIMQFDMSDKKGLDAWVRNVKADSNVYFRSNLVGSGKWNMMSMSIYKDMESYSEGVRRKYYAETPEVYRLTKDIQVFYASEPFFRQVPRAKVVVDSIIAEKGYEPLAGAGDGPTESE